VSSIKDRQQRAAARARLEREMAERAAHARKRRQTLTIVGSGLALLLVVAGAAWLVGSLGGNDKGTQTAATKPGETPCVWNPEASSGQNPSIKDVGMPPTSVPNVGSRVMTISTNLGDIKVPLDLSKVPCTAASFEYLASKNFFDNSKCHRLVTSGIHVLQCGDPSATGKGYRQTDGQGGPSYRYAEENLPTSAPQDKTYPKGTIAMAKTQEPSSTGSQFFINYDDSPLPAQYTLLGTISQGLDIVEKVAKAGHAPGAQNGDGNPKMELVINKLTVSAA
jgi:peptidyl-prolyl cis-trans isomerase B (cyclophilin B)